MPHRCRDPMVAGAQIVMALQTVVARNLDPVAQGVISITQFHGGDADNVIPQEVVLRGTIRSFAPCDLLERRIGEIARAIAEAHQVSAALTYTRGYPPTVNSEAEVELAAAAAAEVVGADRVDRAVAPVMGAEDFAYMLEAQARRLHLHGRRRQRRDADAAQPELRLQRRGAALRRQLLGQTRRATAARSMMRPPTARWRPPDGGAAGRSGRSFSSAALLRACFT